MQLSRRSVRWRSPPRQFVPRAVLGPSLARKAHPPRSSRFPAGGGTDLIAREVANKVAKSGYTFVVDNKPGSGGNLGVDAAAKSPPDGYTLVLGQTSNLAINPTLYSKLPYDPVKDLTPVSLVASAPLVIVVGADSPYKTLADVVAAAKAKPGSINFATSGNGTVAHLAAESFQKSRGHQAHAHPLQGRRPGRHRPDQRPGAAVRVVGPHAASATSRAARCARSRSRLGKRVRRPAAGPNDRRVRLQGV